MKRILVCGDRNWSDRGLLNSTLYELWAEEPFSVVTGGCRGADTMAEEWAKLRGTPALVIEADWSLGRKAGPIRNAQMLTMGQPHLVVAFHDDLEQSRGTKDMVRKAERAGVPVLVVSHRVAGTFSTISQTTMQFEGDSMSNPENPNPEDAEVDVEEQADKAAEAQENSGGTPEQTGPPTSDDQDDEEAK